MFYLSRAGVELLAPFPFTVLLLVLALVLLFLRRVKIGMVFLAIALFIQIFAGYGFFVRQHLAAIEASYPPLTGDSLQEVRQQQISSIVVLGSGHVSDPRLPANSQIGGASLYRLTEGIRLALLQPEAKLILTGGIGYDPVPNAEVVNRVADSLGFPQERIIVENRPRDTLQEAEMLLPVLGDQKFFLVTSALHMPRAMHIFQARGMQPIAAPTDYLFKKELVSSAGALFPSAGNMELARRLLYEWLATAWGKVKTLVK